MNKIFNKKDFKILLVYPNVMLQNTIPINIALLSACLKEAGFNNIKLFDTTFYKTQDITGDEVRVEYLQLKSFDFSEFGIELEKTDLYDDFENIVTEYKPDLIATTMVENTWEQTMKMLSRVKSLNIPVIVGGVNATFAPEEILYYDCVDMICVGEGERAIVELCEKMTINENISNIPNIWLKENGKIIKNKLRKLVDVNSLPFLDFSIFDKKRFFRPQEGKIVKMFPVETTRGCPYSCTFCCASSWSNMFNGKFLRERDLDKVFEEIKYQVNKNNMEYIYFSAETFLAMSTGKFKAFIEKYIKINLPFWFQTRPETINMKRLQTLQQFDFRMSMGIESGSENIRKNILNRKVTNKKIMDAVNILNKLDIKYSVNNVIGLPYETRENIFETIELNRKCKVRNANCFIFVPYRGTALHRLCVKKGYIDKYHVAQEHTVSSTLKMPQITSEEIFGLFKTFPLYVKLPKKYWPEIELAEKETEDGITTYNQLKKMYEKYY